MDIEDPSAYWMPLLELVPRLHCWVRITWRNGSETVEGHWGQMLISPTHGYLEASDGPIPLRDIEWIDLSTTRLKGGVAGIPLQRNDVKDEILASLQGAQLAWELRDSNWTIEGIIENEPVQLLRFMNPIESKIEGMAPLVP